MKINNKHTMKKIKNFKFNPANDANSYLLISNNKAILIDGGFNFGEIDNYLIKNNLTLTDILLTHFHADHVAGIDSLAKKYNAVIHISKKDFPFILDDNLNGSKRNCPTNYNDTSIVFNKFDFNETRCINDFEINYVVVGGHTPGSTFYSVDNKHLFVGDTLFKNGLGFHNAASNNLREELKTLLVQTCNDDDFYSSLNLILSDFSKYKIYPGHWEFGFTVQDVKDSKSHPIHKVIDI